MTRFAWLIERNRTSSPEYLRVIEERRYPMEGYGALNWTNDANEALQFSRAQDAKWFMILHHDFTVPGEVVEHGFIID